jgi:hypothetical protein
MKRAVLRLSVAVVFVSITIPKAGFKVGDVPLTLGNVLFGLLLALCVAAFVSGARVGSTEVTRLAALLTIYMALRTALSAAVGSFDIGFTFALVLAPLIFFAITSAATTAEDLRIIERAFVWGFGLLVTYAAAQAIVGIDAITIPGVTVNWTDFQTGSDWYLDKDNRVGSFTKLFATYQNGNLLGLNLILIYSVVHEAVRKQWHIVTVPAFIVVGLLTLSRSAWIGVAVYMLVRFVLTRPASPGAAAGRVVLGSGLLLSLPVLFGALPQLTNRLFQASDAQTLLNAAGRTPRLIELISSTVSDPVALILGPLGIAAYRGSAYEVLYGAIYMIGGLIAVSLFIAILVRGIRVMRKSPSPLARGVAAGLVAYGVAAAVDGAFWLPPTALNFWAVVAVGLVAHRAAVREQTLVEADPAQGLAILAPSLSPTPAAPVRERA